MAVQRIFRIASYFSLYVVCVLPINTLAKDNEYYSTWEMQEAGEYRLVWYYETEDSFKRNQPDKVLVGDKVFIMRPDVRPPTANGVYMLQYSHVNEGEEVLDVGTGSGVHAVFAAEKAKRIVATDIYPPAVENAKTNAKLHGVEDKIDFRVGDLFEPIKDGEKFDVFFININFPFAVGDDRRHELHERFFSEVHKYMKPGARIYYQTSFVKNLPYIYDLLERNNFRIMEMHMVHMVNLAHEPMFFMIKSR